MADLSKTSPWVPVGLLIVGAVLIISGAAASKNKAALGSLLGVGITVITVGVTLWIMITKARKCAAQQNEAPTVQNSTQLSAADVSAPPAPSQAQPQPQPQPRRRRRQSAPPAARSSRRRLKWRDEADASHGKNLEEFVLFDYNACPGEVQASPRHTSPAHSPKPVPAIHPRLRPGYESASQPAPTVVPHQEKCQDTGPVFYRPQRRYPSVDDIALERQAFNARPDTPDIDRRRRVGLLQEAALMMGPPRDGHMVPISIGKPGAS